MTVPASQHTGTDPRMFADLINFERHDGSATDSCMVYCVTCGQYHDSRCMCPRCYGNHRSATVEVLP